MNGDKNVFVILIPGFPANESDSTCLPFPQSFVKNFKRLNPSLHIVVLAFQYPFSAGQYDWHGVEVYAFNGRNKGKFNRLYLWWTIWKKLKKIMKHGKVMGILNFWMGECALIGKYASKKFKVRSFTWLLGQDARKGNRYFSMIKPNPESLLALSDFVSDELLKNYKIRPAHTVPPGIDITLFPPRTPEKQIDILGAGSLIPLKQFEQFIKTVAKLAVTRPGIRTVICGDGPEFERLHQMIHFHKLDDHIELAGEQDYVKVLAMMQASKILLHPSSYEGFGLVFSEALYAGAHVVSYCKPMHTSFNHMHIVASEEEMASTVAGLLDSPSLNGEPVLTYSIEEPCMKILSLYI